MSKYINMAMDEHVVVIEGKDAAGNRDYSLVLRKDGEEEEPITCKLSRDDLMAVASAIREMSVLALHSCVLVAATTDNSCTIWDKETGTFVRMGRFSATTLASFIMVLLGEEASIGIRAFPIDPEAAKNVGEALCALPEAQLVLIPVIDTSTYRAYLGEKYLCTLTLDERPGVSLSKNFLEKAVRKNEFPTTYRH